MRITKDSPISQQVFINRVENICKGLGREDVVNEYSEGKPTNETTTILLIDQDTLDNLVVKMSYSCVVVKKGKRETDEILNDTFEREYVIKEMELVDSIYHNLSVDYLYLFNELDTTKQHPNVIFKVSSLHKSGVPNQYLYCSLKYYYEFLKNKKQKNVSYQAFNHYAYIGALHYIYGKEWEDMYEYVCKYFKVKDKYPNEFLSSQLIWLMQKYNYNCEDIKLALKYYYEVLDNPIPDKATLGVIPKIMQKAKYEVAEENDRKLLTKFIYELFDLEEDSVYPLIQAEIRRYHSREYGKLTYKGMKSTLDYYYNILGNPLPQIPNVGIIPYQYNNALAFYKQRKAVKDSGNLPSTVPVVRIHVSKEAREQSNRLYEDRYKWKPTKSISEIEVEEDETFDRL